MSINVGDGIVKLIADPSGVDRELAQMGRKGTRAGKQVTAGLKPVSAGLSNIKNLAIGVGLVFGAWQAIRILKNTAKAAIEFGKQFANVATLINTQTPIGVKQLKILKQQIFDLRPELGSATELTKGLYQALSAGAAPAGAVRLVGEAALFAKAGLTDTLTAVDLMTTILNAYGKSAEDAAAVSATLFKTIELGKTTGQELAGALGRVIPVAASLNVSLPELNSALATMTKSGLSTAEAVTSLRAILKTFISPESAKRFDELGISAATLRDMITKDGLNAALQELGKRLGGSTAKTAELFREQEAQVGVFTLLGAGADEYKRILDELIVAEKEATATTIAADKQFDTLDERFKAIGVTIQKEFIIAFENMLPAIEGVLTSFGATGVSGENLRIILNAIAWSVLALTQAFLFWKGTIEAFLLSLERMHLATLEFQKRAFGLIGVVGNLDKRIAAARDTVDSLTNAMQTDLEQVGKLEAKLVELGQDLKFVAEVAPRAAGGIDKIGDAAGRAAEPLELFIVRLKQIPTLLREGESLVEPFIAKIEELGEIPTLLRPGEALEEQAEKGTTALQKLRDLGGQALQDLTGAFQQAVQAWILGGGSIGEAMKRAAAGVLAGVAAQAAVLAIFELAKGFAALFFNPAEAASHFKAAALFSATAVAAGAAAKAIAPPGRAATVTGGRGEARGVITAGGEEEEAGPLIVERRLAMGGLITRPTLAMLGEHAPAIKELVVPLLQGGGGVGGSAADRDSGAVGTTIQIFIEGMISPDVLDDVIQQISERVEGSDVRLSSTSSLRVISRS
ncbi:hypothetical protein LCGC14_1315020 [marine sediment metagenome]|uniref:Phage tail tape measure protein domain-containing protein n=1 Tax=marine sediment metagenome TaxID=412755 RepID=A0A0F9L6F2_9ZZZZ